MSGRKEAVRAVEDYLETEGGKSAWRYRRLYDGMSPVQNMIATINAVLANGNVLSLEYHITVIDAINRIGRRTLTEWNLYI